MPTVFAGVSPINRLDQDEFYLIPQQPLSNITWDHLYAKIQRKAHANQCMVPAVPYVPPKR